MIKQIAVVAASAMVVVTIAFAAGAPAAYAAPKVDCDTVMNELHKGKDANDVATALSISVSSVDQCKRHAKAAADSGTGASSEKSQPQASPVLRGGESEESAGGCPQEPCPPDASNPR